MKRPHRSTHARIWSILGWALPLALLTLLALKQTPPNDRPAVLLKAPEAQGSSQ